MQKKLSNAKTCYPPRKPVIQCKNMLSNLKTCYPTGKKVIQLPTQNVLSNAKMYYSLRKHVTCYPRLKHAMNRENNFSSANKMLFNSKICYPTQKTCYPTQKTCYPTRKTFYSTPKHVSKLKTCFDVVIITQRWNPNNNYDYYCILVIHFVPPFLCVYLN